MTDVIFIKQMEIDDPNLIEAPRFLSSQSNQEALAFEKQFHSWKKEFETWKQANIHHPDKISYYNYNQQFKIIHRKLLKESIKYLINLLSA